MSALAITADDRRHWSVAAAIALAAHLGVAVVVLTGVRPAEPPVPEPVVLVELPPDAAPAPVMAIEQQAQPQPPQATPRTETPPIDIPPVHVPVPQNAVTLPPPLPPLPARPAPAAAALPMAAVNPAPPVQAGAGTSTAPGDPRARKQEMDYFALVSAHLNRRKTYPVDAKKARQEGVVVIRFTVDRDGNVMGAAIKRGSGHDILDLATLQLLQRVAPLPHMPATMLRQSVTLSLPIEYALKTD